MIDDKNFGNRLTECMKIAGYTNSKLTEELSLSKNAVGNYKNNQIPNATILYNISQLLGTTMEYLLTGKHENENLTDEEKNIIAAYRKITPAEQGVIKKILDIQEQEEKLSQSKIISIQDWITKKTW